MDTFLAATLALVAADQLIKRAVRGRFADGHYLARLGPLRLVRVENPGTAFGWLPDARWLHTAVAVLVVASLVWAVWVGRWDPSFHVAVGLIAGGSLGNAWDRLARGTVTDYLSVAGSAVFNLADAAITVGLLIAAALALV